MNCVIWENKTKQEEGVGMYFSYYNAYLAFRSPRFDPINAQYN